MTSNAINAIVESDSATWPPDYSSYADLDGDAMVHAVERESKSRRAPGSYRAFHSKIHKLMSSHRSTVSERDKRISTLQHDKAALTEYLANSRKNYDELCRFLRDERIARRDAEAKASELEQALEREREQRQREQQQQPAATMTTSPSSSPPTQQQAPSTSQPSSPQQQQRQQQEAEPPSSEVVALRRQVMEQEQMLERWVEGRKAMEKEVLMQMRRIHQSHTQKLQEAKSEAVQLAALVQAKNQAIAQLQQSTDSQTQAKDQIIAQLRTENERFQQAFAALVQQRLPQFATPAIRTDPLYTQQHQHQRQQQSPTTAATATATSSSHSPPQQQQQQQQQLSSIAIPHPPTQPSAAAHAHPAQLALPKQRTRHDQQYPHSQRNQQ